MSSRNPENGPTHPNPQKPNPDIIRERGPHGTLLTSQDFGVRFDESMPTVSEDKLTALLKTLRDTPPSKGHRRFR